MGYFHTCNHIPSVLHFFRDDNVIKLENALIQTKLASKLKRPLVFLAYFGWLGVNKVILPSKN